MTNTDNVKQMNDSKYENTFCGAPTRMFFHKSCKYGCKFGDTNKTKCIINNENLKKLNETCANIKFNDSNNRGDVCLLSDCSSINFNNLDKLHSSLKAQYEEIHDPSINNNQLVCINKNLLPPKEISHGTGGLFGGGNKKYKKTSGRINIHGKTRIVYLGPRGGKYVKMNKKFVSVSQLK